MISGYDVDPKTLSWIKEEVNKTANDAQIALELFVEHPEDNAQIQLCADYLHRIRGALEIVEIFGAALLANQMEQVAIGLVHNKIELKKEAIDVLMCGLLQLPAYLEHLYHGHKDIPLVLLPLLNDLLAVQNKELQTESTFFFLISQFTNLHRIKSHFQPGKPKPLQKNCVPLIWSGYWVCSAISKLKRIYEN